MKLRTKLRLWWYQLWIRKDEFHYSLNMDMRLMMDMDRDERHEYLQDLIRRRNIAHDKDM